MDPFVVRLSLEGGKLLDLHGPADITKETTDAIVNAANSYLIGGGGVDGAIHRAGGPAILKQCKAIAAQIGPLPAGKAILTTGGQLAAKHVIHTVGPVWSGGDRSERETLASCYQESIRIADKHGIRSLAFPSVSTGAYGYPVHEAAQVAISATIRALARSVHVTHARFVLFDVATVQAYVSALEKLRQAGAISPLSVEKGSR